LGKSLRAFIRLLPPKYEDGMVVSKQSQRF
jgi:hypothetical protein